MPWRGSRSAAAPLFLSAVCLLSKVNSDAFLDLPDNEIHILRDGFCSVHTQDGTVQRFEPVLDERFRSGGGKREKSFLRLMQIAPALHSFAEFLK